MKRIPIALIAITTALSGRIRQFFQVGSSVFTPEYSGNTSMIQHLQKSIKQHPLAWFYVTSVLIEVAIIPIFTFTGAPIRFG